MAESPKGKGECKWQLGGECSPCRNREGAQRADGEETAIKREPKPRRR